VASSRLRCVIYAGKLVKNKIWKRIALTHSSPN